MLQRQALNKEKASDPLLLVKHLLLGTCTKQNQPIFPCSSSHWCPSWQQQHGVRSCARADSTAAPALPWPLLRPAHHVCPTEHRSQQGSGTTLPITHPAAAGTGVLFPSSSSRQLLILTPNALSWWVISPPLPFCWAAALLDCWGAELLALSMPFSLRDSTELC